MGQVGKPFHLLGALILLASLASPEPARAEENAAGMQMQIRRTGPPVRIVRPARGPDIVYLRGEQRMQNEEEKARIKYVMRRVDDAEKREAAAKTAYKPLKKPDRAPAAVAKPVVAKAAFKTAPSKPGASEPAAATAKKATLKTVKARSRTTPTDGPKVSQRELKTKAKIAASN